MSYLPMEQNSRKKLIVAAGLFGVAGALFVWMRPRPDVPDDLAESAHYYCDSCKLGFDISVDAPRDTFAEVEIGSADEGKPRAHGRRESAQVERVAKCSTCGKYSAHRARRCRSCGASFEVYNKDGKAMICPTCKWDPTTGETAVGERLDVLGG